MPKVDGISTCRCGTRRSISATAISRLNDALKRAGRPAAAGRKPVSGTSEEDRARAATIARDAESEVWPQGAACTLTSAARRRSRNSLKLVRNERSNGKSLMFAFEGGYHGRTLGASAITSSYRYRRRFPEHFGDRAHFLPFPYHFRGPKGMRARRKIRASPACKQFERLFESEYNGVWDPKAGQAEYAAFYVEAVQGTGGYESHSARETFFIELKKVLDRHGILLVVDEMQIGFFPHRQALVDRAFRGNARCDRVRQGPDQRAQSVVEGSGRREELINPKIFPPGSTHSTFALPIRSARQSGSKR